MSEAKRQRPTVGARPTTILTEACGRVPMAKRGRSPIGAPVSQLASCATGRGRWPPRRRERQAQGPQSRNANPAGCMAAISDPRGAIARKPLRLVGPETINEPGAMTWNDLLTSDTEAARGFYSARLDGTSTPSPRAAGCAGSSSLSRTNPGSSRSSTPRGHARQAPVTQGCSSAPMSLRQTLLHMTTPVPVLTALGQGSHRDAPDRPHGASGAGVVADPKGQPHAPGRRSPRPIPAARQPQIPRSCER